MSNLRRERQQAFVRSASSGPMSMIRSIIGSSISFLSLLTGNVLRTECLPIALPGELVGGLFQVRGGRRSVEGRWRVRPGRPSLCYVCLPLCLHVSLLSIAPTLLLHNTPSSTPSTGPFPTDSFLGMPSSAMKESQN